MGWQEVQRCGQDRHLNKDVQSNFGLHVSYCHFADKRTQRSHGRYWLVISTRRRNTGGQLAINNDDGLPNGRPIAFSEPLRNQLSHNAIFSAALVPPRNL
jgi:hypothetical protein